MAKTMRRDLIVEGGYFRVGSIFDEVYVEIAQEGTSLFRFGDLVQGFVKISNQKKGIGV